MHTSPASREWIANIFCYTKDGTTIMIDAGYSYERLKEKMGWLDIDPASIRHILLIREDDAMRKLFPIHTPATREIGWPV